MEMIDVLDAQGNFTGQIKSRADVHRDGDWHRTVHVWILNSKGELLIQKRSATRDINANKWDMSCAGHISAGKTSLETAVEESAEELGITLKPEQFEYLFPTKKSKVLESGLLINDFHDVFLVQADIEIKDIVLQAEEVSEVRLVHYTELEKLILSIKEKFCAHPEEYQKIFALLHERYG